MRNFNKKEIPLRKIPQYTKEYLLKTNSSTKLIDSKGNSVTIENDKGEEKNIEVSKLDLYDFSGLSDNQIIEAIKIDTGIDLSLSEGGKENEEGIKKINELLTIAISTFYKGSRRGRILQKRGISINNIGLELPFKTQKSILLFLKSISEDRQNKKLLKADLKCYITKVASVVNNLLNNGLNKIEEIELLLFAKFSKILNISPIGGDFYKGQLNGRKFLFYGRPKTESSCIGKGLSDVEYSNLSKIKDGIGYTLEVKGNHEDILYILKSALNAIRSLGGENLKIKVKGFEKLNLKDFNDIDIERSKKSTIGKDYEDIKVCGTISGIKGGIEIKVTRRGNKNQKGLNFQYIYKILNTDIEGTLLRHFNEGIIDKKDIEEEVDLFFETIEKELEKNPETKGISLKEYEIQLWEDMSRAGLINTKRSTHRKAFENQLKKGLVAYYESKLIKLGDGLYTSERANTINSVWKEQKF